MQLIEATEKDDEKLRHFFPQVPFPGVAPLVYARPKSFFWQYQLQSQHYQTFMLQDEEENILGVASFIFREALLENEVTTIGYATDLRILANRRAILGWSQHFLPLMQRLTTKYNCRAIFSVLSMKERQALNAFVTPKLNPGKNRQLPRYCLFHKFDVVSIHGKLPWVRRPLVGVNLRCAELNDLAPLAHFLNMQHQGRPLHNLYSEEKLLARLQQWPDFALNNILLAFDREQNLIGSMATWNSHQVQTITPLRGSEQFKTVQRSLAVGSAFGITHALGAIGDPFRFRYLTLLTASNSDVFEALLYETWQHTPKTEFLAYGHFADDRYLNPPKNWLTYQQPHALYTMIEPDQSLPSFLHPKGSSRAPEFEIAFL